MSGSHSHYLFELFLPLNDACGVGFPTRTIQATVEALRTRFGGATLYSRAPAHGFDKPAATRLSSST
jgi:hypothetical protein